MITDFQQFGFWHLLALFLAVSIIAIFVIIALKIPKKVRSVSLALAVTIISVRSVRYLFDIQIGTFSPLDLLSIHICHIDLILLILCLIRPNRNIFTFTLLVGTPAALAVALFPGQIHPEPGLARAVFFIMSHTLIALTPIYLLVVNRFLIKKDDLKLYYLFSLIGMVVIYIFNYLANTNFMYLMYGPKGTVLGAMYDRLGSVTYLIAVYLILISVMTLVFIGYKLIESRLKTQPSLKPAKQNTDIDFDNEK